MQFIPHAIDNCLSMIHLPVILAAVHTGGIADGVISRDLDGSFNEDYCKWCYTDSKFTYDSMEQLLEFLVTHMSSEQFPPEQARTYFSQTLPKLKHWNQ